LLWMLFKLLIEEWVYEHTNSRRTIGGNYSVSIYVGVQLESYPNALMTINFSSKEDVACGERSRRSQPRGFTLTKGVNGLTLCVFYSSAEHWMPPQVHNLLEIDINAYIWIIELSINSLSDYRSKICFITCI